MPPPTREKKPAKPLSRRVGNISQPTVVVSGLRFTGIFCFNAEGIVVDNAVYSWRDTKKIIIKIICRSFFCACLIWWIKGNKSYGCVCLQRTGYNGIHAGLESVSLFRDERDTRTRQSNLYSSVPATCRWETDIPPLKHFPLGRPPDVSPPCFFAYSDISPIPFNDEQGVWETSGGKCQGGMSYMYTLASTWSFDTTTLIPRLRNRANIELAQAGLLASRPWLKCRPRHRLLKSISTTALLCIARRCI